MSRLFPLLFMLLLNPLPAHAELDLEQWNTLLASAVTDGFVDYSQWHANPHFDTLVEQVAESDTAAMDYRQKLAFYINAYNILAAKGILAGRSPDSLLGRYIYFKRDKYQVATETMTLYQLEHEWMRPLKEPRIHFAIVCASKSCPILQGEAYSSEGLDEQLEMAARVFINDTARNSFNVVSREANLSSIFKWFEQDFEEAAGSLQSYLAPMVDDPEVAAILNAGNFDISYKKYNWSLNGTR
jgi:hypothetical protein